jgi:hypothetical protein
MLGIINRHKNIKFKILKWINKKSISSSAELGETKQNE